MISEKTQRVLDFLSAASSYPHHPASVKKVQTHASWVFIVPPFVYKIKKPVNFGFLDFTTLEQRRADCEREVQLNRRLAEDVYLGIEPVCELDGKIGFSSAGTVVEWAVKMRFLDPEFFLSHLLQQDRVEIRDMDRIVERLQSFYANQPRPPENEAATAIERLRMSTDGNFQTAREFIGRSLSRSAFDAIVLFTETFYTRQKSLLETRIREGWIRDCHGDLHSEHIHLAPDAVRIYDCIEFNTRFRHIDLAADIAFLAMDLDFNARPDLARHIVDSFAASLHDEGMKPLMDFYKCYRACVRGKVESLHSATETAGADEKQSSLQLAQRYFRLALQYAINGSQPRVFVFMGRIASGKSALSKELARETGWALLSSDALRKTLAGVPLHHRGDDTERALLYAPEMAMKTYDTLTARAIDSLRAGHSIILDATFSKASNCAALHKAMQDAGFRVVWIEVQASEASVKERLKKRDDDPAVVSDARLGDYEQLNQSYEPPDEISDKDKIVLCTDSDVGLTFVSLLNALAFQRASCALK